MSARLLSIAVAGALGALARYGVGGFVPRASDGFPWPTLAVNLSGSFVLGVLVSLFATRIDVSPPTRLAATVGFLGAYTTFSTFGLEVVRLIETGRVAAAAAYVSASVVLGVGVAYAGTVLGRAG